MKLDPYLLPCIKINSNLIKDLKLKQGMLQLLRKNTDVHIDKNFLTRTPISGEISPMINKLDDMKFKRFYPKTE